MIGPLVGHVGSNVFLVLPSCVFIGPMAGLAGSRFLIGTSWIFIPVLEKIPSHAEWKSFLIRSSKEEWVSTPPGVLAAMLFSWLVADVLPFLFLVGAILSSVSSFNTTV